ncbi:MAG: DUF6431 domain-containing protein [Lachnospiraceae bacterium]|nr:DUF6431 domain-containing protein [Lachnospiraceae bacterium]
MITIMVEEGQTITPIAYKNIITSLDFNRLTCTCGRVGDLKVHAYYQRSIKTVAGNLRFHICRVICESCGHSHAILPSSIIPYSQISLFDQTYIINNYEAGRSHNSAMDNNPMIDESNCRYIIRNYLNRWKKRIKKKRILSGAAPGLTKFCFSHFSAQFMQNKNTSNILYTGPVNTT